MSKPETSTPTKPRPVRFTLVCDWRHGIAPPIQALKRILKLLGRVYNVRVTASDLQEAE